MIPGYICFRQEGQDVIYLSQLGGLTDLPLIGLLGTFDNGLPSIPGKGLVRVCRNR